MMSGQSSSSGSSATSAASAATRLSAHSLSRSSSSTDKSYLSVTSDVDTRDNFYNSEGRAGGPYLCSLPARSMEISRDWYTHCDALMRERESLTNSISNFVKTHGLRHASVQIIGRQSKISPQHHALPTVLVMARRSDQPGPQDWRDISRAVYRWMNQQLPGICVEILDEDEAEMPQCYPVTKAASIHVKWNAISRTILNELDIKLWTSLQCHHYGKNREPTANPITIIITVQHSSNERFLASQTEIQAILTSFAETTTSVVFLEDQYEKLIDFSGPARLDNAAIGERALPGVSLGIRHSSAGSSTFGGYVELKFPAHPWKPYGLTCFHCVYPPPKHRESLNCKEGAQQAFEQWKCSAITKYDTRAREILQVDHPSAYDLQANDDLLAADIASTKDDKFKELEQRINLINQRSDEVYVSDKERIFYAQRMKYIANRQHSKTLILEFMAKKNFHLGHVVFGSGLNRTVRNRDEVMPSIRDWALIQIDSKRLGHNNVYTYGRPFSPETLEIVASRNPEEFTDLVKCGRSTMMTTGKYCGLNAIHITSGKTVMGEEVMIKTSEHAISPSSGIFADRGDSGSFVFTPAGDVVGILVAGASRVNTVFFQHIQDVFDDIKSVTGATDVRLMPTSRNY